MRIFRAREKGHILGKHPCLRHRLISGEIVVVELTANKKVLTLHQRHNDQSTTRWILYYALCNILNIRSRELNLNTKNSMCYLLTVVTLPSLKRCISRIVKTCNISSCMLYVSQE